MKRLLLISLFLIPIASFAGKASGGGDLIDVIFDDGTIKTELYDLVSSYTCDWQAGDQFVDSRPGFLSKIKQIEKLDWYFAQELEKEARSLRYCQTENLLPIFKQVPTNPDYKKTERAAFRFNREVFWAPTSETDDDSLDFLVFHEVLHSYIDMTWSYQLKYLRLTSMVKSLERVWTKEIDTRKDLHDEMIGNHIQFPRVNEQMDRYKNQIQFYLQNFNFQKMAILQSEKPLEYLEFDTSVVQYLSVWDRAFWRNNVSIASNFESIVLKLIIKSTLNEFKTLLTKDFGNINIQLEALFLQEQLSVEKQNYLLEQIEVQELLLKPYQELTEISLFVSQEPLVRPMIGKSLSTIYRSEFVEDKSLTSINPLNIRLSSGLKLLADQASIWINQGDWEKLKYYILNEPLFYDSLGLKSQMRTLEGIQT
ncbi:MAG: hypothetical protein VX642_14250, partial [Bdellovibrionota bacterium]|nr:hypothetical protein [Bdellovibrionota bacterium]